MISCPHCGSPTSLLAGIVLYEHRNRAAYADAFDVCWRDNIHRRRGQAEWCKIGSLKPAPADVKWTVHSPYHWSIWLRGAQLNYWPTKNKIAWKGQIRKGYGASQALELARRIADDAGVRL